MRSLVMLAALGLVACSADPSDSSPGGSVSPEVVRWATESAVELATTDPEAPLDDLEPLRHIVEDARVVFLGESRHDAGDQFRMKHRIIRFLVEEMGFKSACASREGYFRSTTDPFIVPRLWPANMDAEAFEQWLSSWVNPAS